LALAGLMGRNTSHRTNEIKATLVQLEFIYNFRWARHLEFDCLGRYRSALSANRQIDARDARNSDRFVFMSGIDSAILALF
jgi:hypothetical protein